MPDVGEFATSNQKWQTTDITYSVYSRPLITDNLDIASIDDAIDDAFKAWEDVSRLTFRRVDPSASSIIKVFLLHTLIHMLVFNCEKVEEYAAKTLKHEKLQRISIILLKSLVCASTL